MDKKVANKIVSETFNASFDKEAFVRFIKELLNHIEQAPFVYRGNLIPDAYDKYINTLERIGKYDDGENKIDILVVNLKKEKSIERARSMQRNFIAWYLNGSRGGEMKDAALVAFVSPDQEDWRFSLVKMDYKFEEKKDGRVKVKEVFTPARRWSFLVGKNENSHTAKSRLAPIVCDDDHNPTLKELEDAFNIEKVTKEFFEKYRELFLWAKESFDKIIKEETGVKKDFEAKGVNTVDFTKKLLGQIVFLYFLQKKGWFGVSRDANWGTGPKNFLRELFESKHSKYNNFFNDILEPLFYEALAREREDSFYSRFNCKIPFLNGGLFDPINNYDWVHIDINLPNELFSNEFKTKEGDIGNGILDIFDRYNFTVKEDEPLEKEVAVDPEMLGKVFENLLEVKDRKSKGTYYTPREIVHYMCEQSLLNYLSTELEGKVKKDEVEQLIKYGESVIENETCIELKGKETKRYNYKLPESIRKNAKLIDDKLADIKVCDPAVGSGAFPVGMMAEIIKARSVLSAYIKDKNRTIYDFKRHCIQNSLYGVDIDLGAVEIAKLRLWLSLVVDEEDIKTIKPLPNLDYKIVCGDSLLGYPYKPQWTKQIEELKTEFFQATDPKTKRIIKDKIDSKIGEFLSNSKKSLGYNVNFDFELFFSEVFDEKNGFDIIIGNPPYVQSRNINKEERRIYWNQYLTDTNHSDSFSFFMQKGIKLLKPMGTMSYIVSETWRSLPSYKSLRKFILNTSIIKSIVLFDLNYKVFESAEVKPLVIVLQRGQKKNNPIKIEKFADGNFLVVSILDQNSFLENENYSFSIFESSIVESIINKIKLTSVNLMDKYEVVGGLRTGDDKRFLRQEKEKPEDKKLIRGRDFGRYYIQWSGEYVWYKPELMKVKQAAAPKEAKIFESKKIIVRMISGSEVISTIDCTGYYLLQDNMILEKEKEYKLEFLLSLLNSKLINFYIKKIATNIAVTQSVLNYLPIKLANKDNQKDFIKIVDKILDITKSDDYLVNSTKQAKVKEYESQIDKMVYKLYDLTPEEIEIVNNNK